MQNSYHNLIYIYKNFSSIFFWGGDGILGWRKSDKWGRSNSWRDESDSGEGGSLSKSASRTSSWGRGWADEGLRGRSHDEDSLSSKRSNFVDEVPEWAMENPSESGGSFDASGAFHGGNYSDEEEVPKKFHIFCSKYFFF